MLSSADRGTPVLTGFSDLTFSFSWLFFSVMDIIILIPLNYEKAFSVTLRLAQFAQGVSFYCLSRVEGTHSEKAFSVTSSTRVVRSGSIILLPEPSRRHTFRKSVFGNLFDSVVIML